MFLLRVIGQFIVSIHPVDFLPPIGEWYSGLIPYPILLPIQIVVILIMIKIILDFTRGEGYFVTPRRRAGIFLKWSSYIYFASMVVRYMFTMWLHPEQRWFVGTIPIWFHMVLASFIYTLSHQFLQDQTS